MIVGPGGSGKTTLAGILNEEEKRARRTQDVIYGVRTIDVPGAYIENAHMYNHLISIGQDASHVLMLVNQERTAEVYSPGFAKVFRCPVFGVVTKIDRFPENAEICERQLRNLGIQEPFFRVNLISGEGISELREALFGKR